MQLYSASEGSWTFIESMPFHLCNLMWFNSIYLLLTKKQWSFEMMLFIGMPAAFHSLLTPQLNHGNEFINVFDFFFGHGWLFACCFYCIFVLGMKPRIKSWWYSFLRLQDIIAFVFLANFTKPNVCRMRAAKLLPSRRRLISRYRYDFFNVSILYLFYLNYH